MAEADGESSLAQTERTLTFEAPKEDMISRQKGEDRWPFQTQNVYLMIGAGWMGCYYPTLVSTFSREF